LSKYKIEQLLGRIIKNLYEDKISQKSLESKVNHLEIQNNELVTQHNKIFQELLKKK